VNIRRTLDLVARDLGRGPRSPTFLYALTMPVIIALVTKVVLLAVLDPEPRLGIVDLGASEVTIAATQLDGLELTLLDDADVLRAQVEAHDLDAGLLLPEGFDAAVKGGERPDFQFWMAGESRVTQRIVLAITSLDLIRAVEGRPPPARVITNVVGEGSSLPIADLIVLGILLWPLLVCSTLVPGMMLVQERESRTLQALLVTPTTLPEILLGKAAIGFGMSMTLCIVTLALCGVTPPHPLAFGLTLAIAALICSEIGLLYGAAARDGKTLYNIAQTANMLLLAPLVFYFFPGWPQWPAHLFPTWYFIDPLYRIGMQGADLAAVWPDLLVASMVALAMVAPVVLLARRMKAKMVGS
jgi:ABC-2 type transport system permease protein